MERLLSCLDKNAENVGGKIPPRKDIYIISAKDDKTNCLPSNIKQKASTYRFFSRLGSFFSQLPLNEQTNGLEKLIVRENLVQMRQQKSTIPALKWAQIPRETSKRRKTRSVSDLVFKSQPFTLTRKPFPKHKLKIQEARYRAVNKILLHNCCVT